MIDIMRFCSKHPSSVYGVSVTDDLFAVREVLVKGWAHIERREWAGKEGVCKGWESFPAEESLGKDAALYIFM